MASPYVSLVYTVAVGLLLNKILIEETKRGDTRMIFSQFDRIEDIFSHFFCNRGLVQTWSIRQSYINYKISLLSKLFYIYEVSVLGIGFF